MRLLSLTLLVLVALAPACSGQGAEEESSDDDGPADVTAVEVSGEAGDYTFTVTVRSPDTGCEQYADWWEVVSPAGVLVYRRVLLHSHVDEQPFTRNGGPVEIGPDSTVLVRAHMNTTGYGGQALRGTPADGFSPADLPDDFAEDLAEASPQPDDCGF
jgi:hypothetical protein